MTCTCTCDSITFARVGDTILCCRCKRPVSLRPASDLLSVAHRLPEREFDRRRQLEVYRSNSRNSRME